MSAWRPHGRNDPSLTSSIEPALTEARRPGLVEWVRRGDWELAGLACLAGSQATLASSDWLSPRGPGWRQVQHRCACRQPAIG